MDDDSNTCSLEFKVTSVFPIEEGVDGDGMAEALFNLRVKDDGIHRIEFGRVVRRVYKG